MSSGRRTARLVGVVALTLVLAAACSSQDPDYRVSAPGRAFGSNVDGIMAEIGDGAVSEHQREVLRTAQETGEISYADYEALVGETVRCMEDAGLHVDGPVVQEYAGITRLSISFASSSGADEGPEVGDACQTEHSFYVEMLWDTVPANVADAERAFEEVRPVLVDCLRAQDVTVQGEETKDELLAIAADAMERAAAGGVTDPAANCLGSSGWFG